MLCHCENCIFGTAVVRNSWSDGLKVGPSTQPLQLGSTGVVALEPSRRSWEGPFQLDQAAAASSKPRRSWNQRRMPPCAHGLLGQPHSRPHVAWLCPSTPCSAPPARMPGMLLYASLHPFCKAPGLVCKSSIDCVSILGGRHVKGGVRSQATAAEWWGECCSAPGHTLVGRQGQQSSFATQGSIWSGIYVDISRGSSAVRAVRLWVKPCERLETDAGWCSCCGRPRDFNCRGLRRSSGQAPLHLLSLLRPAVPRRLLVLIL